MNPRFAPVIYIAGPFTAPDAFQVRRNVDRAEQAAHALISACIAAGIVAGRLPVTLVPHSLGAHFNGTFSAEYWYNATAALLLRCDAILMIEGWQNSKGARTELDAMIREGRPAFFVAEDAVHWIIEGCGRV